MKLYQMQDYNYDRSLPDPVIVAKTAKEAGEIFYKDAFNVVIEDHGEYACANIDEGELLVWINEVKHEDEVLVCNTKSLIEILNKCEQK